MAIGRAGPLDKKIQINRRTTSRDSTGDVVEAFSSLVSPWASVRNVEGLEGGTNLMDTAESTFIFRIRKISTKIKKNDQVVWNSLIFDVVRIVDLSFDGQHFLEITAEAKEI